MKGISLLEYIPLQLTAFERSVQLLDLTKSWIPPNFVWLDEQDWFSTSHKKLNNVWYPAPAASQVVVEEWCRQLHKRSKGCMIGIVPRLMTSRLKKQWKKAAKLVLKLSIGSTAWVSNQHKPLLIFISLPLCRNSL